MRTNSLFNFSPMNKILWAPPADDGGIESGDVTGDDDTLFDDGVDSDAEFNGDLGDDGEINLEDDPDLQDYWKGLDDDDNPDESPEDRTTRLRSEESAMATELKNGIDSFALADDLIPADFNPSDPQQMREILSNAIRQGSAMTMQLMFKPVNKALQTHNQNLRDYVEQHSANNNTNNRFESLLTREIPAVRDPLSGPMIRHLAAVQRKRFPNDPAQAVRAVQKGLRAMGIPTRGGRKGGANTPPGSQSGTGMLDGFFTGLPTPKQRLKK